MPCQDVEHDTGRMHVVRQHLCTGGFNGFQPIGQNDPKYIDHLTVSAGQAFELFAHAPYGKGQFPFFERRAIAQSPRFAREDRQIM